MADVELNLVSDTRDAQAQYGTEMPDALERMAEALDAVDRSGEQAVEGLESGFRDILDGAGEAGSALEDMSEEGESASVSVRSIGSTAKQAFEGDFAGAANAAVGLLRGFGPAGVVAGTAAAVGIGFITSAAQEAQKATEEMTAKISSAYASAIADGRAFLTEAEILAIAHETLTDPAKRENARKDAEAIALDMQTYIRAQAGDEEALATVLANTNALIRERKEALAGRPGDINTGATAEDLDQQLSILRPILAENEAIRDAIRESEQAASDYAAVVAAGTGEFVAMRDVINDIPDEVRVKIGVDRTELDKVLKDAKKGITIGARIGTATYGGSAG